MQFDKIQVSGFEISEAQYTKATQDILKGYQNAYLTIRKRLQDLFTSTLSGVDPEDYFITMVKYDRLEKLLSQIAEDYKSYAIAAGKTQAQAGQLAINAAYYRQLYALSWAPEASAVFTILPKDVIDMSVLGTKDFWKTISRENRAKWNSDKLKELFPQYGTLSELLAKHRTADLARIREAITQSFIQGDNFTKTAAKLKDIMNNAAYQAKRIAVTEGVRNLNAGNWLANERAKELGIDLKRRWSATLDSRTRPTHRRADGKIEDEQGQFSVGQATGPYPGQLSLVGENVNCHCSVVSIVEGIEPKARRAVNPVTGKSEIIGWQSYDDWIETNGATLSTSGLVTPKKP
jgi:SPP1 gp7 family putative phage head morphogenesis protein